MNLGEIRSKFITLSGRDDLVNSDDSDNGANFFINAGQRMLDRKIDFKKSSGVLYKPLAVDGWYVSVEDCRSVQDVWINDDEGRTQLTKRSLEWLKTEFPDLISATDSGTPEYWGISNLRGIDIKHMNSVGSFLNFMVPDSIDDNITGILILQPTSEALVVEITGKFYSPRLVNDEDTTYWTATHEMELVWAALYELEVSYRNTEGANDWLGAVTMALIDIDKDTVDQDNAQVDQMEG